MANGVWLVSPYGTSAGAIERKNSRAVRRIDYRYTIHKYETLQRRAVPGSVQPGKATERQRIRDADSASDIPASIVRIVCPEAEGPHGEHIHKSAVA